MTRHKSLKVFALAGAALVAGCRRRRASARARRRRAAVCSAAARRPTRSRRFRSRRSGENIVFALDKPGTGETTVTAYIQILYSGTASDFSWVLPVDAVPTISVGTDRVFTQVAQLTRPTYGATTVVEGECKADARTPSPNDVGGGGTGTGGFSGGADASAGVNVIFRGDVGPYDAVVLHSTTSAELLKWLADNVFVVSDTARSIIDEYVALNKYFVAVKLLSGQETGAIQPVVLKFAGEVPCVPLKLTAIAALADLPVNLYVLGASRAVPSNYFEITLNQAKIDWFGGGQNYPAMVTAAANEAGGNAFIAEYAGTARVMDTALWPNALINLAAVAEPRPRRRRSCSWCSSRAC